VTANWLTINDSTPTEPKLEIVTANAADKGTYEVEISSKLNTHPTP
jgi:hypothetical protein